MSSHAPAISRALLDHLQKLFPNKLPETHVSPEQLGALQGQQKVINHLLSQFAIQSRTVLDPT